LDKIRAGTATDAEHAALQSAFMRQRDLERAAEAKRHTATTVAEERERPGKAPKKAPATLDAQIGQVKMETPQIREPKPAKGDWDPKAGRWVDAAPERGVATVPTGERGEHVKHIAEHLAQLANADNERTYQDATRRHEQAVTEWNADPRTPGSPAPLPPRPAPDDTEAMDEYKQAREEYKRAKAGMKGDPPKPPVRVTASHEAHMGAAADLYQELGGDFRAQAGKWFGDKPYTKDPEFVRRWMMGELGTTTKAIGSRPIDRVRALEKARRRLLRPDEGLGGGQAPPGLRWAVRTHGGRAREEAGPPPWPRSA
jgi:hypothetical protein